MGWCDAAEGSSDQPLGSERIIEAFLAVIVGLAVGGGIAALVALPLKRRRDASRGDRPARPRRTFLGTPAERQRAALVAAGFAAVATVAHAAGATSFALLMMLGALTIAVQAGAVAALQRIRRNR